MINIYNNSVKTCNYVCLGFESCRKVCEFGAIDIVDDIAAVHKEKCKACGKCAEKSPSKNN